MLVFFSRLLDSSEPVAPRLSRLSFYPQSTRDASTIIERSASPTTIARAADVTTSETEESDKISLLWCNLSSPQRK